MQSRGRTRSCVSDFSQSAASRRGRKRILRPVISIASPRPVQRSGLSFPASSRSTKAALRNAETRKREEAAQLEKALAEGSLLVLLDERGKALDSEGFASLLGTFRDSGKRDLMVAIGGADGLDPSLHARADAVLNLGKMTWPHQLVRILIAEQLYRAVTILSGHPYHRV